MLCATKPIMLPFGSLPEFSFGRCFWRRQLVADLALDDFAQRDILRQKLLERFNQGAIATLELFDAARYDIHENVWIIDYKERLGKIVVSHSEEPASAMKATATEGWDVFMRVLESVRHSKSRPLQTRRISAKSPTRRATRSPAIRLRR
jgi:hypothetical protein